MRWLLLVSLVACTGSRLAEGPATTPAAAPPSAARDCRELDDGALERRKPRCSGEHHRELDFWLGDWDVVVRARKSPDVDGWAVARGVNRISSLLGGCAVEERFSADGPGQPWAGRSLSRWVESEKRWRQAWVDDTGSYLAFTGGMQGKEMVLMGEPSVRDGKTVQMRMVFTDIAADSLTWRWERTTDAGATWTRMMVIEYRRASREPRTAGRGAAASNAPPSYFSGRR